MTEFENEKLELSSPWVIYMNKLKALFEKDPEIHIDYNEEEPEIVLLVDNPTKAAALGELLPFSVDFGNVTLFITVVPANKSYKLSDLYRVAFTGNPVFKSLESITSDLGFPANYCIFKNEVVQYPADNLSSYCGVESTLYEDLAREVFEDNHDGIYFCTSLSSE